MIQTGFSAISLGLMYLTNPALISGSAGTVMGGALQVVALGTVSGTSAEEIITQIQNNTGGEGFETLTNAAYEIGGGSYRLAFITTLIIALIAGFILAARFFTSNTGQSKEENKSRAFNWVIGVILAASIGSIIIMLMKFGTSIFTT